MARPCWSRSSDSSACSMASSEDSCRRATSFAGPDRRQLSGATMGTDESAAERGPAALATRPSMSAICWRRVRMRSRSSREL